MSMTDTFTSPRFWDRIADSYARRPIADEGAYQKKLAITQQYLRPGMNVLEFGCGTGSTALVHAPHVNHIHAIDVSSRMIEIAEGKARAQGVANVAFETATIDGFSGKPQSFDAVLGLNILHLVRDRDAIIAKVYELLRPGGVFVSSTVCAGGAPAYWPFRAILPPASLFGRLPRLRFFTVDELATSMTNAGFSIEHRWQPKKRSVFIVARKPE